MMRYGRCRSSALCWLLAGGSAFGAAALAERPAWAADNAPDAAIVEAQDTFGEVRQGIAGIARIAPKASDLRGPEARIADGELNLRSKDYARASLAFNQVVEKYPNHPTAYADALFLLGETYYEAKEFRSARRVFLQIVDRRNDRRFESYQARSLARLVDVALRIRDYETLDDVFRRMNDLRSDGSLQGELTYARGKGLFAKKDYAGARAALGSVDSRSPHYHQARYLLGVISMKEAGVNPQVGKGEPARPMGTIRAKYAPAIELFRQVTQLPGDTAEHQHIVDLAWLAIGRLFYETDQYVQASEAYGHVDRTSSEFSTMLYELAWDYVRLGDGDRALRSLEILAIAEPNSTYMPDGTLLRADLLLRTGQFEKSLNLYQSARSQYDPMRSQVDGFLGSTKDPAVYYDKLSSEQIEGVQTADTLPPLAVGWAREGEDGPAAFAVIDGAKECRDLLRQAKSHADKVGATLSAPNRVRAFPELKGGEERVLSLLNRLARVRQRLAQGLTRLEDENLSAEPHRAREARRSWERRLEHLPVTDSDFNSRDEQAQKQWNGVSQRTQQLTLQVDQLQALVNGLKRTLAEGSTQGVVRDAATTHQLQAELAQNEQDLAVYRNEIATLRRQIELSRVQVGFADQRFIEDAQVRAAYTKALEEETHLAAVGATGRNAVAYANRMRPLLDEANASDAQLQVLYSDLEGRVEKGASELRVQLEDEVRKLSEYTASLDALDSESRLLVGQVAMRNFGLVRDRLKSIVLRADVGVTEEAWEMRDEELTRVRNLQLERARSEQRLNDELREVLDDSGETTSHSSGGQK